MKALVSMLKVSQAGFGTPRVICLVDHLRRRTQVSRFSTSPVRSHLRISGTQFIEDPEKRRGGASHRETPPASEGSRLGFTSTRVSLVTRPCHDVRDVRDGAAW